MTNLDIANTASEQLITSVEWLEDELKATIGNEHPLLALIEHINAEAHRVAVLCALAASEA